MSKRESYFAQYVSPNIIIVPTVSFSPLGTEPVSSIETEISETTYPHGTEKKSDAHFSSRTYCETVKNNIVVPSPSGFKCNQRNIKIVDKKCPQSTSNSDVTIQNLGLKTQDTISTTAPSKDINQGIEPSLSKLRNSLVDLTGFNLLKRDSGIKHKDSIRIDNTKINQDTTMKPKGKKDHRESSQSDTKKIDNTSKKESSKSVKPTSSHCEGTTGDHENSESKQSKADMEDKMKKYFRHLWKRNMDKLKDMSMKEKSDKDLRCNKTKQHYKDSKLESTRCKTNLQKVSKNTTTKTIRNKITDGSKKYNDLEKKFIAQYSRSSKSESKPDLSHLKDSIIDQKVCLSPVSTKRYKDFQRFIRHSDDHENKIYKPPNQTETETAKKKIRIKSPVTTTKSTNTPNRKQSEKYEPRKADISQNKKETVNVIKSVVCVNNRSQSKCINDLRSRLSRKRTISECYSRYQQPVENKCDQDNVVITLKQEAKADPATLAPNVNKPKTKKCKKIKLIINIECPPDSDSDENFECSTSPQDLSFLDDFNIDEIVDSLSTSHSQVENNNTISTGETKAQFINKLNDNINKCNDDTNMTTTNNNKEKRNSVAPDGVSDENFDTGFVTNTKYRKEKRKIKTNPKINKNIKQEVNKEENAQDIKMELCNDSDDSVFETIDNTGKNKHKSSNSKHFALEENKKSSEPSADRTLLTRSNKPSVKKIVGSESANQKYSSRRKKTIVPKTKSCNEPEDNTQNPLVTVKNACDINIENHFEPSATPSSKKGKPFPKTDDPIEASLKSMFNNIEQNSNSYLDKVVKDKNVLSRNSEDIVEASLQTMFNNTDHEAGTEIVEKPNKQVKQDHNIIISQKSRDAVEESLETIFSGNKQEADTNMDIVNLSAQHTNKGQKTEQIALKTVKVPLETKRNSINQNANKNKIQLSNQASKHITREPQCSHKNIIKQKASNIDNKQSHTSDVNIKDSTKCGGITEKCQTHTNVKDTERTSNSANKKLLEKPYNNKETKITKDIMAVRSSQPSNKNIEEKSDSRISNSENSNKKSPGTIENLVEENASSQMDSKPQSSIIQFNKAKEKHLQPEPEPEETIKKCLETTINNDQKNSDTKISIKVLSKIGDNIKEDSISKDIRKEKTAIKKTQLQGASKENIEILKSKDIAKECINTTFPSAEKKANINNDTLSHKCDKNVKENLENSLLESEDITKKINDTTINNNEKANITFNTLITSDKNSKEKPEEESEETKNKNIDAKTNDSEENDVIDEANISEKKLEEKLEVKLSEKPLETDNNIQNKKDNVTTNDELIKEPVKNIEDTAENTSTSTTENQLVKDNKLIESTKSNVEENQAKPLEIVKSDTQKLTTDEDLSNTKVPNTKITNKDGELAESEQKPVNLNNDTVPGDRKNIVLEEKQKHEETKSNELKGIKKLPKFVEMLKEQTSITLNKKIISTSFFHVGRFSNIHRFTDDKGGTYAVKVIMPSFSQKVKYFKELLQLQSIILSWEESNLLYLINIFEVQGFHCILTEYYPINLKEALYTNKRGYHIDIVQVLSRQIVDAVKMLTNYNIVHSDIKPEHILLNSRHDRVKLCGFDRSNYNEQMSFVPNLGTPSYRAPEIILGYLKDHRIDVWSTALVMFEMATNTKLFSGRFNNDILYQQLCTLGSLPWFVIQNSRFKKKHFYGTSFLRQVGMDCFTLDNLQPSASIRERLHVTYFREWGNRTRRERTKDLDKLDTLDALLEQMLVLDPQQRLPIQYVGANEFIRDSL